MSEITARPYQCRHIFADGHRCGSKCLRNENFCFYHHVSRRRTQPTNDVRDINSFFEIPIPEDRSAIMAGIGVVLQRIAQGQLDPKRAGLLLYGLQIAAVNLPKPLSRRIECVDDVIEDPILGPVAPICQLDTTFAETIEQLIYRKLNQKVISPIPPAQF
jgi:hypothetical protein